MLMKFIDHLMVVQGYEGVVPGSLCLSMSAASAIHGYLGTYILNIAFLPFLP